MSGASPSDTIYLQEGIYKGINNTGLSINKNLNFIGNGSADNVIIDAEKFRYIFFLNAGLNVTFINITFLNGNATFRDGALYINYAGFGSSMTIINFKI